MLEFRARYIKFTVKIIIIMENLIRIYIHKSIIAYIMHHISGSIYYIHVI